MKLLTKETQMQRFEHLHSWQQSSQMLGLSSVRSERGYCDDRFEPKSALRVGTQM